MSSLDLDYRQIIHRSFEKLKNALRVFVVNDSGDPIPTSSIPDTSGSSPQFEDETADVTPTDFPAVSGKAITFLLIVNKETKKDRTVKFSMDGGTKYTEVGAGGFVGYPPKGDITQIKIKRGDATDAVFDLVLNLKA